MTDLDRPAVRVVVTVDLLVEDGLPDASTVPVRLVLAGVPDGTTAMLEVAGGPFVARRIDGELAFELPAELDLSEATLVVTYPDGTITRVTSADSFEDGALSMDLQFQIEEGAPADAATVSAFGAGFRAGSRVLITMHSDPVELATVDAGADGSFDQQLALPDGVEAGEHRIVVTGESADGPISGVWHFSVDTDGDLERIGDPPVEAAVAGAGLAAGAIDAAAAAGVVSIDAAAPAAAPADADQPSAEQAATSDQPPAAIDEATGLATFTPAAEPEQTVEQAVEAFALISILGSGGSLLAAGAAGAAAGAAGGSRRAGGAAGQRGSSGAGGSGAGGNEERGEGGLAGAAAATLGDGADGAAWGDRSPTWRWPLTRAVDRVGLLVPARLHPASPLAARVVADGSTLRALLGSGAMFVPLLGVVLGAVAASQTGGHAVAPSLGLVLAIALLGVVDAFSGFAAAASFGLVVAASGGLHSADSVRSLLGLASMWLAAPLIAGEARAFRRPPSTNVGERWQAAGDLVLGPLLAAWAIQSVVSSLPALSGLDMPIAAHADLVAGVVLTGLVGRYLFERAAVRWYPNRLAEVTFTPADDPSTRQQLLSTLCAAAMFVFVILPYIGPRWQLWAVTAMTIGPSLLGLVQDRFPNSAHLYRLLPRGVPNTLVMITVGTVLGAAVSARFEDPVELLAMSFLLLSVPGFALSLLELFGRDGAEPADGWVARAMCAAVAAVAALTIRGYLGDSPWLPLLIVAPAGVWWLVATRHGTADDTVGALDPVLDVAAGEVADERWPEWPGADVPETETHPAHDLNGFVATRGG